MSAPRVTVVVLAKAPVPGRVKTRLCPPCTPDQAATLAEAALVDTLDAVAATRGIRRVLALDGRVGTWPRFGIRVVAQSEGGLDCRIAGAFGVTAGPILVIGMDTPQVTPRVLEHASRALRAPGTDAVLGPADDGGYWALGLTRPAPAAVLGVAMSTPRTGAEQLHRLEVLGLRVRMLSSARDVDTIDDAGAVARLAPSTRFAAAFRDLPVQIAAEATA